MPSLCQLALVVVIFTANSTASRECENPKGLDGDSFADGCIRHTCKKGVWRVSLNLAQCCYQGKPFQTNSEISATTASDGSSKATINCVLNGNTAEMVLTVENFSKPASTKDVEDFKSLLDSYRTGSFTCTTSTSPATTSESPPTTTSPTIETCPEDWKVFGSKCFKMFRTDKHWDNAQKACETKGGNLTSLHSPEHQTFVNANFPKEHFWIGATDEKTEDEWVWSDGTLWDYTNWCSGEPNNSYGEDCVHYDMNRKCWNDGDCDDNLQFMCEIYSKPPHVYL